MSGAGGGGAGAVVRTGHLRKLKTMKKKFFVLRAETPDNSARLEYYESEKKYKSGAAPRRVIPLKSCYNITRRLDLKQKHVIALFTKEEQFCVVAENEQDLHSWLAAILKQHRNDDASDELLHPIQHVWQVNVQKKGLGASKNIQGLYNLCLTDKTLTLVKIKSQNNVISDLGIPERVEYSLKNIRRCGDSECFFYMEVGRQTATGAGELWMHSDDSNIAQSMHSTIYHAMRNCAKETESERDHIMVPKRDSAEGPMPARRQTYSDGRGRAGLANAENQPPNNSLTDEKNPPRVIKHHRTISLPTGCPLFQEPLKIVHERTRSAPLTGDEVDRAILEKTATHSSCKAVNGTDVFAKKSQWSRRASTGARFAKLSPAHSKNAGPLRNRCDSMPSRASSSFEVERPPPRHNDLDGLDLTRDEADSVEWHRTPRIPEEPDFCDSAIRDLMRYEITSLRGSSYQHSRTSSIGLEDGEVGTPSGYVAMAPHDVTGLVSASSGSVCSGTPSTSHRFSEYQLERATSHIVDVERPLRAYSVGSRPAGGWGGARAERGGADAPRHRAYSVGARKPAARAAPHAQHVYSAPQLPRASADDLMELDFSHNSPAAKSVVMSRTPPTMSFERADARVTDEYVDMSPRNAGYVEMRPMAPSASSGLSAPSAGLSTPTTGLSAPADLPKTPDGYVEMNYGRAATRPIAIAAARAPPPAAPLASPDERRRLRNGHGTPLGSQTIFPLSLDSPASPPGPPGPHPADLFDDTLHEAPHHPLTTVRELSEDGRAAREGPVSVSPSYVALAYKPVDELPRTEPAKGEAVTAGATVVLAGKPASAARFSIADDNSAPATPAPTGPGTPLNYASLDLEPCGGVSAVPARTYTQIDFVRSEKLHADAN